MEQHTDDPRRIGIDGDLVWGHLHGENLCQAADGPLARAVVSQQLKWFESNDTRGTDNFVTRATLRHGPLLQSSASQQACNSSTRP